ANRSRVCDCRLWGVVGSGKNGGKRGREWLQGLAGNTLHSIAAELKPVAVKLATSYFGFKEDERRKVYAIDGIKFVEDASKKQY
nr:methyltransferase-like protein 13 [Tanacetum cinerariifolium]